MFKLYLFIGVLLLITTFVVLKIYKRRYHIIEVGVYLLGLVFMVLGAQQMLIFMYDKHVVNTACYIDRECFPEMGTYWIGGFLFLFISGCIITSGFMLSYTPHDLERIHE